MESKRYKDLSLLDLGEDYLIVACDSAGAIGEKVYDEFKVDYKILGYFTARVPLMEILSMGGSIFSIVNTFSVEMNPSGEKILLGIKDLLREAQINIECLNGSTEENFKTSQTGIGITVLGRAPKDKIRMKRLKAGNLICAIGLPKVGPELNLPLDKEIVSLEDLRTLLESQGVGEISPVGSKGIGYEASLLAEINNLSLELFTDIGLDINKSAGPATSMVFSLEEDQYEGLKEKLNKELYRIGIVK